MHRFRKKSTGVTCGSGVEVIELGNTECPIDNGDRLTFKVPSDLESNTDNVELEINGEDFLLLSCATNNIKADQLQVNTCYAVVLGTETPSARLLTPVCPTAYVFPSIPVPTSAAALVSEEGGGE